MSVALRKQPSIAAKDPAPAQPRNPFSSLQLEDFAVAVKGHPARTFDMQDLEAARQDGWAEGAAAAKDRQLADLVAALADTGTLMTQLRQEQDQAARRSRAGSVILLRAIASALFPLGQEQRLIDAMVDIIHETAGASQPQLTVHCPERLHERITTACMTGDLPPPQLIDAQEVSVRLSGEVVKVDLADMQTRLLDLVAAYAKGED